MLYMLLMLWLVPLVVALFSRRRYPRHLWRNTGVGLGLDLGLLVVDPGIWRVRQNLALEIRIYVF
jgi:hypothetical protein